MKKIQALDEYGRSKALERYAKPEPQSEHGHSEMDRNLAHKYETELPKKAKGGACG